MLAGVSDLGEGVPIMSSKVQADQGTEWMRQNIILSGPFEVPEWTQQKGVYLEARSDGEHWKGMPDTVLSPRYRSIQLSGRGHPLEHSVRL